MSQPTLNPNLDLSGLYAQGNALSGLGQSPQQAMANLGPMYQQAYQGATNLNQQLLSGTQTGYDTLRQNVDQQYNDVAKGYQSLYGDVLGRIAGSNQTNLTDINAAYNASGGGINQNLISRGLGNSTVVNAMQRGNELDRQRALTASNNQFAQLGAGYASALGQAGLGAQQQGIGLGASLGQAQLGALERVSAPYPNAGLYANLAQMYGSNIQRQQDQQRADQLQRPGIGFGQGGMGVGSGSGNNTPFKGPTPFFGQSGGGVSIGGYGAPGFGGFGGLGSNAPPQTFNPNAYGDTGPWNGGSGTMTGGTTTAPTPFGGSPYGAYGDPTTVGGAGGGATIGGGMGGYNTYGNAGFGSNFYGDTGGVDSFDASNFYGV